MYKTNYRIKMNYSGKDYQKKRIKKHQKFLLKLLHLHIGNYYPLRKWLGISYKGKINQITNLSIAYNAKKLKKGYQITRTYQQLDIGMKLNLVLDKIPQLALLPALLQPAYGLAALAFFFLTQTTYQPSSKDAYVYGGAPTTNYGSATVLKTMQETPNRPNKILRSFIEFDISDIPEGAIFSQGDLQLKYWQWETRDPVGRTVCAYKLTRTDWVEGQATWNIYKTGSNWTTAGGDFVTSNPSGGSVNMPADTGWVTWEIDAIVQDAYDNGDDVEILVKFDNETLGDETNAAPNFRSNNYATDADRPKLTVTFTVAAADNSVFFGCNF